MFKSTAGKVFGSLVRRVISFEHQKDPILNNKMMMYAQVVKAFGPAQSAFQLEKVPVPEINQGQMLVKVTASSVNPVDCKIRGGLYPMMTPDMPAILHSDVVGEVVRIGSSVSRFKLGDQVYGCAGGFKGRQGAIAEFMVVDEELMALKPRSLSDTESASLPLVALTSWLALIDRAQIKQDQHVLIHAASGGVGSIALQLALWKRAKTYVTTSDEKKASFARQCGASIINYKTTSVEQYVAEHTDGKGFDVVFDTVGGDNLNSSFQAIKNGGTVCAIAACPSADLRPLHRKGGTLHYIFMPNTIMSLTDTVDRKHYAEILTEIAKLADEGTVKPLVGACVNFSEIAKAHAMQEAHEVVGKIALQQDL